jgi:Recombinase
MERAEALRPLFAELAGMSANAIAAELNARGVPTPKGGVWHAGTVIRIQRRLAAPRDQRAQPDPQRAARTRWRSVLVRFVASEAALGGVLGAIGRACDGIWQAPRPAGNARSNSILISWPGCVTVPARVG